MINIGFDPTSGNVTEPSFGPVLAHRRVESCIYPAIRNARCKQLLDKMILASWVVVCHLRQAYI